MAAVIEETETKPDDPSTHTEPGLQPLFSRIGFKGTVQMRDFFEHTSGAIYRNVMGIVSIYRDLELVGFNTRGTEANWAAVVEGDTERVVILGCQIRSVTSYQKNVGDEGKFPESNAHDTYRVP